MARVAEVWLAGDDDGRGRRNRAENVLEGVSAGDFVEERVAARHAAMI